MKRRCINVGAGKSYLPGFINIDISPRADLTLDLNKDKLPFDDSTVDLGVSFSTLEHIGNYLHALEEIHRVLKHGAPLLVTLPYVTLAYYHQVNPYHLHNFNECSFDFFDPDIKRGSAAEEVTEEHAIEFKRGWHRYHYVGAFKFMPPPVRGWCRRHLWNTVRRVDIGVVAIKGELDGVELDGRDLRAQFEAYKNARVSY